MQIEHLGFGAKRKDDNIRRYSGDLKCPGCGWKVYIPADVKKHQREYGCKNPACTIERVRIVVRVRKDV